MTNSISTTTTSKPKHHLETGIDDPELKKKYDVLWEKALLEVHPFQKGDSHQGTEHCLHIINHLSKLTENKNLSDIEKYLLCCATALHDLDKAIIDYKDKVDTKNLHGVKGGDFIRHNYELFKLDEEEARAIAFIVEKHGAVGFNNEDQLYRNFTISGIDQEINLPSLAALFKLADMMDFTHKRLSKVISRLNYSEKLTPPKLLARKKIDKFQIDGSNINVSTLELYDCLDYQSVLIAIDMMNTELLETKTVQELKTGAYPYIFKLKNPILSTGIVRNFKEKRDLISRFNSEGCLTIDSSNEDKLMKVYQEYPNSLNFSPGELEQIKPISPTLYSEISKKSIDQIAGKMRAHFAYSINELTITRVYDRHCGIKCFVEYKDINKPKGLNVSLPHTPTEYSAMAKFITAECAYAGTNKCIYVEKVEQKDGMVSGRFAWENTNGQSFIDKLYCSYEIENAYAYTQDDIKRFYPDDLETYENFIYNMIYPICKLNIVLEFPIGYNLDHDSFECKRTMDGKDTKDIDFTYDKGRNRYLIQILNQSITDIEKSPSYIFKWDIPKTIES